MIALKIIYTIFYVSCYGMFLIVSVDLETTYQKTYYFLLTVFSVMLAFMISLNIVNLWR